MADILARVAKRHPPKTKADLQAKLGVVVRACRRQLGITQEELAWRASMHRTYIADIERGARNVSLRSVANLAKALEVTVGELLAHATDRTSNLKTGAAQTGSTTREILLIEDSAADAALTQRAFKRAKVTNPLRVVRSAEEGLDYLLAARRISKRKPGYPALILLDLNLPQMSGIEFLRRVKADDALRAIPIVVLTVSRTDRMIVECGRLGADNYIVKPVGIENFFRITPKLNLHLTVAAESETLDPV